MVLNNFVNISVTKFYILIRVLYSMDFGPCSDEINVLIFPCFGKRRYNKWCLLIISFLFI